MRMLSAAVTVVAMILAALPAGANEQTTIAITSSAVNGSTITVDGVLTLGADATEPFTISTDPQGDARVPAGGFDLGDSTVVADYSGTSPRLVVEQQIFGGMPDEDGNPPGMGFSWPIKIGDGGGDPQWLAAGSAGTNFTPSDTWWTGLCVNGEGGWICDTPVPGTVTEDAITWSVPFTMVGARAGRTVSASSAHGGRPNSFVWPSVLVTAGLISTDTATAPIEYVIPGSVEAGIAPAGTPLGAVPWSAETPFAHKTGTYQLNLPAPADAGDYAVWVRTCFGDGWEPTCVVASQPLTL